MKKLFLIACCLISAACCCFSQQDAQYNQYMFNQLALNPAYAGSRDVLAASLVYRDQWTGIPGAPNTASLAVQMPLRNKKIGVGAEIISDKLGPKNVSALLLSYAYRIKVGRGKLAFGLRTGAYNYVVDWNKINYKDLNDVYHINNAGIRSSIFTFTGDFGMYYYTHTFYWGLGMNHLNQGKMTETSMGDSSARQAVHYFMPIGKAFQVGNTVINPSVLFKGASGAPSQMDLSITILLKESFWIGVSARSKYGFVFLTQYLINDKMKVGYSCDLFTNKIGTIGKWTHEIMIGYDINIPGTKMIMPRYL